MKLFIVIVNYNVQYFLEQCLESVERAMHGIDGDVWVVDNNSVDGSLAMLEQKFPKVKVIANKENVGFSRANNQAIEQSGAEYALLLNPDTVVQEDTFRKVVAYMDEHPTCGGLGIRMVDGKGKFLPESKRGLPSPWPAFCKISGLYRLAPRSRRFNSYYAGHVPVDQTAEVEILSGAFMLLRKTALDQVGLLDETFFMYGEDIDLSYRLILGGFHNVYFADSSIIHYKGESTKKGSLNYVFVFYNAMIIFARKHFSSQHARAFTWVINLAIYARAALAIVQRFIKQTLLPVLDFGALAGGMWLIKAWYSQWKDMVYDDQLLLWSFGVYCIVHMFTAWLGGAYDRSSRMLHVLSGWLAASLILLIGYSLLPEELRFSRAITLLAMVWAGCYFILSRSLLHLFIPRRFRWPGNQRRKCAVVGSPQETDRVLSLMSQTRIGGQTAIRVAPGADLPEGYLGRVDQLSEIIRVHRVDEVIFCGKDLTSQEIISSMSALSATNVEFRIAPSESLYIIGSNSINTSGDLFMLDVNSVSKPQNQRRKRVLDVVVSLAALITAPIHVWGVRRKGNFLVNVFSVLFGRKSWVGYADGGMEEVSLPPIKDGVLHPLIHLRTAPSGVENITKLNTLYARDYRLMNDLKIIGQSHRFWGD